MAPFKRKPRQPAMTKAQLREQGVQALAQATTPIIKLPMKSRQKETEPSVRRRFLGALGQAAACLYLKMWRSWTQSTIAGREIKR